MKGIELRFECQDCGNTMTRRTVVLETPSQLKADISGFKCVCGRKNLDLLGFSEQEVFIGKENKEGEEERKD